MNTIQYCRLVSVLYVLHCSLAFADMLPASTFDAGSEGWTAGERVTNVGYSSTMGNPPGSFTAADNGNFAWYFISGPAFAGDFSQAYEGYLLYDLWVSHANPAPSAAAYVILFAAGGMELHFKPPLDGWPPTAGRWRQYEVPLVVSNMWELPSGLKPSEQQFRYMLSHLHKVHIRGEFGISPEDFGHIDNVKLIAACDLNMDGLVDTDDMMFFLEQWLHEGCIGQCSADINRSGRVDLHDFAVLAEQWLDGYETAIYQ